MSWVGAQDFIEMVVDLILIKSWIETRKIGRKIVSINSSKVMSIPTLFLSSSLCKNNLDAF